MPKSEHKYVRHLKGDYEKMHGVNLKMEFGESIRLTDGTWELHLNDVRTGDNGFATGSLVKILPNGKRRYISEAVVMIRGKIRAYPVKKRKSRVKPDAVLNS